MNDIKTLLEKLKGISDSREGNLLIYQDSPESMDSQVSFLQKYLKEINPSVVLETGTNFGCFSILVKETLPNAKVITFGIDSWSRPAINIINEYYDDNFIEFIQGDSRQTFSLYKPSVDIDFAWIDGGHMYEVCTMDLDNCDRLKIKHVFVDDFEDEPNPLTVQSSVIDFCNRTKYNIIEINDDARHIVYLKRE